MLLAELYIRLLDSVKEDLRHYIREHPFCSAYDIENFFDGMGCPFLSFGLGPIETVLLAIPDVLYIEGLGYVIIPSDGFMDDDENVQTADDDDLSGFTDIELDELSELEDM
ncbi:hypothetical protein ABEB36_010822 [Hypothenemus hampei]|uniref:Uncharacterized protein n=1 Tax=Hypothenemus hampei TaxID=57062 RepID=A0ABD1ED49_HYPHA